jgi:polysaccharide export outer membrane protein
LYQDRGSSTIPTHDLPTRRFAVRLLAVSVPTALFGLVSCSPGSDLPPLPDSPSGPYRLSVNDQVRIITFGEDSLTGEFRVNDRGIISIPLLGPVQADGLTSAELERHVEEQLKDKELLSDPHVSAEVIAYRPVFILGEVIKPGEYPYQPGMTVLTAVALAGGFTYRAQTGSASILRRTDGHVTEGRAPRGTEVLPGDVITILERYF